MTECSKIITDKKRLKELNKKTFGERHVTMQQRAKNCQLSKMKKGKK